MGREARLREEGRAKAAAAPFEWHNADFAPLNGGPYAIACEITCDCGKGGRFVTTGDRLNGQWVVNCEHAIDIVLFTHLPIPQDFFRGRDQHNRSGAH